MKLKLIQIGNSKGLRLPKPLLEQVGIHKDVEVLVEGNTLLLKAVSKHPRQDWAAAFQKMAEHGDDRLLDAEAGLETTWDAEEWEW
jgi:antitoxin MazE